MRPATAIALCLGVFTSLAAHADVYRWVDARGEVHYSDRWVPGSELIKVDRGRPSTAGSPAARTEPDQSAPRVSEERIREQLAQTASAEALRNDLAKKRSEQCEQAKDRYDKSIAARRIFKTGASGEREYLTDAQAEEYRLAARRDMDTACGSSTAR